MKKKAAKNAYKIFAASKKSRENINKELNISNEDIAIFSPIIDVNHYSYKGVEERNNKDEYILYMGIFSKRKNIDLLLKSFQIINKKNKNKNLKLKLVGKTNGHKNYFNKLISDLDLSDYVEIVGEVADNKIWYQNAICTISTSYEEGFGMVLAESLACGTPVIATNSGGVTDIVIDNITGFVVNYDELEISEKIIELYEDKELRKSFSESGRKHIENSFSIETTGPKFIKEYKNFLKVKNDS